MNRPTQLFLLPMVVIQAIPHSQEGWDDFPGRVIADPNKGLKQDLFKISTHIRQLDYELTVMLTNYTIGDGIQLLDKLNIYNKAAQKLLDYLKTHKLATLCVAEDILDKGGPDFMDLDLDKEKLQAKMNCTDNNLKQIDSLQEVTIKIWSGLFNICNNIG